MFGNLLSFGRSAFSWADSNYPWTNVYGVARTLLAIGTALTLIFNETHLLFRPGAGIPSYPVCEGITRWGLFCFTNPFLEVGRWTAVAILVVVASGWRPRYTALAHWWVSFSLHSSALTVDGGDQVASVLTFLLLPLALTDNRRWHWQTVPVVSASSMTETARRLTGLTTLVALRVQVSIIYFHAAVAKLNMEDWLNGTVLYYWLTDSTIGLPDFLWFLIPVVSSPFVVVLTWSTLLLELLLFMALVIPRRYWPYLLGAGVLFHLGIALTMGLISFGFAMVAALTLYLRSYDKIFSFARFRNLFSLSRVRLSDPTAADPLRAS